MTDAVALAKALISCPSVTPARGAVFDVLGDALVAQGFAVERFVAGEAPDGPVENLLATRGEAGEQFAFAGHLDVVPPGEGWSADAFAPEVKDGLLYGRGAVDMKASIAAFVAAAEGVADKRVTLIITGDEEGPATFGTVEIIARMKQKRLIPDLCLVGEPTSSTRLGDTVKIGRRGSVNMWIEVAGTQGHVAYPHLANNPIPRLIRILSQIEAIELDNGTAWFQASNIEITSVDVGNLATNVIPATAKARLSIRFNDLQSGESLVKMIDSVVKSEPGASLVARISGEAFLTPPGSLSARISSAIEAETGLVPELSTTGGTSDARFLSRLCPTVEFGLCNATMHKVDEAVVLADIETLTRIYRRILTADA